MYLTEYQKISIDNFMGLWNRGSLDDVPADHATDIQNVAFARKREVVTRPGASVGRPTTSNVIRQFLACFDNNFLIPIHCDGAGHIWRDDNNTILLSLPGLVDMDCLNMNDRVYILPMFDTAADAASQEMYVWVRPDQLPRPAAGFPPPAVNFTAFATGGGHTGPGWYGVSVSYVTDTGFVTAPLSLPDGTWQTVQLLNNTSQISITNIPAIANAAPPGTTGLIIWVTQGQQDIIDPNSATTPPARLPGTGQPLAANAKLFQYAQLSLAQAQAAYPYYLNFFDTDLTISADALPGNGNILNSLAFLPVGIGFGSASLAKYHGRMLIIGTTFIRHPDGGLVGFTDDRVWISNAGQPETFDQLTGYINVQSESDGNTNRTAFELFSVLYICKGVGTYATQDNGSEPLDSVNPWRINLVDGGIGAFHHSVGTITGSQPSLSFNSTAFLANRAGLFLFNGNVLRPELTWKIRAIWQRMTHGAEVQIRVAVDIYSDLFYVLMAADGSTLPNLMLVGDYSLGLDAQNIRWTIYKFPWVVNDIMMAYYPGDADGHLDYFLRMGSNGTIYKLDGQTNTDVGTAIDNYYQCSPLVVGDIGSLNIYRFIRYRMAGAGTLLTTVMDQGEYAIQTETSVLPLPFPGNYKDQGIQINFTNEKAIVRFRMNATTDYFRMARLDLFGRQRWPTRPNG